MNNKEYHASPAVSNSKLSRFLESPRLMNTPRKSTPALRWGSLVHTIILEPQLVGSEWAVMPEGLDKGKGAKAREEEFAAASVGLEVVTHTEYQQLIAIAAAVQEDAEAASLLAGAGVNESSYFWTDPITGIDMRCRPDRYREDGLIVDVKTTRDDGVELYSFKRSVVKYGYDRQSAIYTDGIEAVTSRKPIGFAYIAIEGKEAPEIFVQVFVMTEADIEFGRRRYRKGLDQMKEYIDKHGPDPANWPSKIGPGVVEVNISEWNA